MAVVAIVTVLLILAPLLLAAGTVAVIASASLRRSIRRSIRGSLQRSFRHRFGPSASGGQPPPTVSANGPEAAEAAARPAPDWATTRARFAQLRSEYGQFECDPLAVLRLPALTDVTVPSTGRFVDAFAAAQALDTDTQPPAAHQAQFAEAVDRAWRAWHAALDAAERIRLAGIPAEERATVQRAIKLLTMARDSDHDAERIAAYTRARAELAKLERTGTVRLPPAAAAALDTAARGQLPPSAATGS